LVSAGTGVIYKGSGFYTTDYRSESYKKAAQKDRESTADAQDKKSNGKDKE